MSDRGERQSLLLPILIPVGGLALIVVVLFTFSRVLLSLKPNAATGVALVAAAGIMTVAAFVSSRRSVTGASLGSFVGAAAGIAMAAGGIAIVAIGPPEEEVEPFHATLAAPEGAIQSGFSTDALTFEADVPVELEFDNEDPGVGHNVQIFDGPDDSAPSLFDGTAITGPDAIPYAIAPLAPGEYFFHCRLHPGTAMQGTITVQEGAGGVTVVAKDTAFDTDEIQLPAETPSMLTLDNEDPFDHNLSIYEDDTASGEPLFTFEPFAGPDSKPFDVPAIPEGEYYFHCDIHPTMNGTVVVAPPPPGEGGPGSGPGDGGDEGG
ncbi:MAG: cupredoxin domain-containing protein [Actinomycetota bacterium]|jgi:plastocyanin